MQQVVAAAAVDGLGEVGADEHVVAVGADQVEVLRVEVGVEDGLVGEDQALDGVGLAAGAVVLAFQRDAFAGGLRA
jgi:hypothetical protein